MKEKIIIIAAISLLAFAAFALPVGRSATMNLAFSIGQQPATDVLTAADNFSSSHNAASGTVVALVSAGQGFYNSSMNSSYSSGANMISLTQQLEGNRFLIVATNGSSQQISGKMRQMKDGFISTVFGILPQYAASSFPIHLIVFYDDADLQNDTIFSGPEEIIIKNFGAVEDGRANITIELTK